MSENLSLYAEMLREPWRCDGCRKLIYNLDSQGYPCRGAPFPNFLSGDLARVCWLCFELVVAIRDKEYWKQLQEKDKSTVGKLKPGANYFS